MAAQVVLILLEVAVIMEGEEGEVVVAERHLTHSGAPRHLLPRQRLSTLLAAEEGLKLRLLPSLFPRWLHRLVATHSVRRHRLLPLHLLLLSTPSVRLPQLPLRLPLRRPSPPAASMHLEQRRSRHLQGTDSEISAAHQLQLLPLPRCTTR
jgi:hypothetical protein